MKTIPLTNKYRTMTEIAQETIKEAILHGTYTPGERLIPAKMEEELGLGRVAIREALKELAGMGLVAFEPNRGAVVAKSISLDEVQEVFEMRYDLEGRAAYRATLRISEAEIDALARLNTELMAAIHDPQEYYGLNRKFHLELYRASGWNFLCRVITMLYDQVLVFRSLYPPSEEKRDQYRSDHFHMIEALRRRDADGVRRMMIGHLRDGFENIKSLTLGREGAASDSGGD